MNETPRYAVIGNPIAHSLSPQVHAEFARECGIDLDYGKLLAPVDGFAKVTQAFFDSGGRGMNVTAPFKGDAARWVDSLDDNAALTESVNTIDFTGARSRGHSTDGPGLVADLTHGWGLTLTGLRILILGAGGAIRGVMPAFLASQPKRMVIANRTLARAESLVAQFQHLSTNPLEAQSLDLDDSQFDLVINATSGAFDAPSPRIARALNRALCYDLGYDLQQDTPFCREARRRGAEDVRDGLGMLVWQAALSFQIWHGVLPDAEAVLCRFIRASDCFGESGPCRR